MATAPPEPEPTEATPTLYSQSRAPRRARAVDTTARHHSAVASILSASLLSNRSTRRLRPDPLMLLRHSMALSGLALPRAYAPLPLPRTYAPPPTRTCSSAATARPAPPPARTAPPPPRSQLLPRPAPCSNPSPRPALQPPGTPFPTARALLRPAPLRLRTASPRLRDRHGSKEVRKRGSLQERRRERGERGDLHRTVRRAPHAMTRVGTSGN
ncbi:hypothetical protein BRADI_5g11255v3 [Brachypodium distachyon]|uniref:Uncharacterized protein n=1 Tax=Brachypodium distachyon TaxID=15368 RepID=A0A0Q3E553_BRADI|nr:hypothetical protein BRADI_5g11255v3 [Brachypodium distachyon]